MTTKTVAATRESFAHLFYGRLEVIFKDANFWVDLVSEIAERLWTTKYASPPQLTLAVIFVDRPLFHIVTTLIKKSFKW
jgi:hypothetical protein